MSTIDSIIAGAVYDFAAYLTALKTPVEFGSTKDAAPAAEAVKAWLDAQGLRPTNDPNLPWRSALTRVTTQYRNPDTGEWCNFASGLHERASIACGVYELRDLYTITAPPARVKPVPSGLYEAIAHGDAEHKAWLKAALEAYFAGEPLPPPAAEPTLDGEEHF